MTKDHNITELINAHYSGNKAAFDRVVELLEPEMRIIAHAHLARVGGGGTLSTTAVVNEAYLKLVNASGETPVNRSHFLAIAAKSMRNLLIDHARRRTAGKRGGELHKVDLDETKLAVADQAEYLVRLDQALIALAEIDPRLVQVFECRFFAGLTDAETADCLQLPHRTVQRTWMKAKAFLSEHFQ